MEEYIGFVFFIIILGIVTGVIGEWIARKKGRRAGEGFWLGFLLSFIGLIIEVVLPKISKPEPVKRPSGIDGRVFDASASDGRPRRKCPFCAEMILEEASVCRYCQRDVPHGDVRQEPSSNVLYLNESGTASELNSKQTEQVAQAPAQTEQVVQAPAQTEQVVQAPAQTEQVVQAPAQTEQVVQAPAPLTCPSCARKVSANDAFCFFCGKKL